MKNNFLPQTMPENKTDGTAPKYSKWWNYSCLLADFVFIVLNCGPREDSWESLEQQGNQASQF